MDLYTLFTLCSRWTIPFNTTDGSLVPACNLSHTLNQARNNGHLACRLWRWRKNSDILQTRNKDHEHINGIMYARIMEDPEYTTILTATTSEPAEARHRRRNTEAGTIGHHTWRRRLHREAIALRQHQPATETGLDQGALSLFLLLFALLL